MYTIKMLFMPSASAKIPSQSSGIVQCVPGESSVNENPVIQSLKRLKQLSSADDETSLNEIVEFLDSLNELCGLKGSGNAAIATKNGAVELVMSILQKLKTSNSDRGIVLALSALASLLYGMDLIHVYFCIPIAILECNIWHYSRIKIFMLLHFLKTLKLSN